MCVLISVKVDKLDAENAPKLRKLTSKQSIIFSFRVETRFLALPYHMRYATLVTESRAENT